MKQPWHTIEDQLLRELYQDLPTADVAALLARSCSSVYQHAANMGLRKSAEFMASDMAALIRPGKQHPAMVASRFKPGMTAWNKGIHFVSGGRSVETQFKKGQMTGAAKQKYVPVGSLRTSKDGYLERKITDDQSVAPRRRWVGVHRLVWEATHGPIPAGKIVVFREGSRTSSLELLTADKLECIDRAEHVRRNHPRFKNPELGRLVQLKGAINRQVNRIAREAERALQ